MKLITKVFSIILIVISIFSCNEDKLIPSKKMQDILVDMSVAQAFLSNNNVNDSVRIRTYSAICKKHNVTMSQWNNSLSLYSGKYISVYKIIYQNAMDSVSKVYTILQQRQSSLDSIRNLEYRIISGDVDSINIIDRNSIVLDNYFATAYDKNLSMPYQDSYSLKMSCNTFGLYRLDTVALMKLKLYYSDSTDTVIQKPILKNGINDIRVNIATGKSVNRVSGGIYHLTRENYFRVGNMELMRMDVFNE